MEGGHSCPPRTAGWQFYMGLRRLDAAFERDNVSAGNQSAAEAAHCKKHQNAYTKLKAVIASAANDNDILQLSRWSVAISAESVIIAKSKTGHSCSPRTTG